MADEEALKKLKGGIAVWNKWQKDQRESYPEDISSAYPKGANLAGANLSGADLAGAYLLGADLAGADLTDANLTRATLTGAIFRRANFTNTNLTGANFDDVKLTNVLGLTQSQLNEINYNKDSPPQLPKGLILPRSVGLGNESEDLNEEIQDSGDETDFFNSEDVFNEPDFFNPGVGSENEASEVFDATSEEGKRPLRVHPRDRQILSNELKTPTVLFRRNNSSEELMELKKLLNRCEPAIERPPPGENILRVPMEQEALDLLRSIVGTAIEIHKAPSYPPGLIDALIGIHHALHGIKATADAIPFNPLPKLLNDKIDSAVAAYDGFLTELGLI